jgi:CRISPR-associated protein Csm4
MGTWKIVELKFDPCLAHFGELGIGMESTIERVYSDNLFSAWMSAYARLYPEEIEGLFDLFLNNNPPPIRISSTFIYRKTSEGTIYYLPRPLRFPVNYPAEDLAFFKTYKSLHYLPLEIWQRWYQGEGFNHEDIEELEERAKKGGEGTEGKLAQTGLFDYKQAFSTDKVPKIAVDRNTRATNLYHVAFVRFVAEGENERSGLYFLVNICSTGEFWQKRLENALNWLGEEGIGGERSSGAGRFQATWLDLSEAGSPWREMIEYSGTPVNYSLISLFWDDNQSFLQELSVNYISSYQLQERGGWIAESNIRRQNVRMFAEGSVFFTQPAGKLINVTPRELRKQDGGYKTHPIYRNGISVSLPIKVSNC